MRQSILPNVVEVAEKHSLDIDSKTLGKKEVRAKCPFCNPEKDKFYLSLNEDKNVFKCWYCKQSGGVVKFISLLEGTPEQEVLESFRKKSGSGYQKHPAERLTRTQLSLIGYPDVDWVENRKYDIELYKAFREAVYRKWLQYVDDRKKFAYKLLFVGLTSGTLNKSIEQVKEIEFELNESFLNQLLNCLFQESKNESTFELECNAAELVGRTHPFETLL